MIDTNRALEILQSAPEIDAFRPEPYSGKKSRSIKATWQLDSDPDSGKALQACMSVGHSKHGSHYYCTVNVQTVEHQSGYSVTSFTVFDDRHFRLPSRVMSRYSAKQLQAYFDDMLTELREHGADGSEKVLRVFGQTFAAEAVTLAELEG